MRGGHVFVDCTGIVQCESRSEGKDFMRKEKPVWHPFDLRRLFHLHACWKQEVCISKE